MHILLWPPDRDGLPEVKGPAALSSCSKKKAALRTAFLYFINIVFDDYGLAGPPPVSDVTATTADATKRERRIMLPPSLLSSFCVEPARTALVSTTRPAIESDFAAVGAAMPTVGATTTAPAKQIAVIVLTSFIISPSPMS